MQVKLNPECRERVIEWFADEINILQSIISAHEKDLRPHAAVQAEKSHAHVKALMAAVEHLKYRGDKG